MAAEDSFAALMRRVRTGDGDAVTELFQLYEPEVRRIVRMRLTDPRMRRVLDSADVCQSVMANFFLRAATGQFDLESPRDLLKLLATMARNRVLSHVAREQAQRRDSRRRAGADDALAVVPDAQPTPSAIVAGKELLEQARLLLSAEERNLVERRADGQEWAEIARELGGSAEALRKKLGRALDRVAAQLGLEEPAHE